MRTTVIVWMLMLAASAIGQSTAIADSKIALLDSGRLGDSTRGILMLATAEQSICCTDTEFTFAGPKLRAEISIVEEQIGRLKCASSPTGSLERQLADLKRRYKEMEDADKSATDKRYSIVVAPVIARIRVLLKDYETQKGIDVIIDKAYMDSGAIIIEHPENFLDITDDFIRFCNGAFANKK